MQSDGPYKMVGGIFDGPNGFNFRIVWGPDFKLDDKIVAEEIIKIANLAYSEGRKAAEKDFEELLMHANAMAFCSPSAIYLKFLDWKRARGIE